MGKKLDIECFLDQTLAFLRANLNDKIAAIDLEKNDAITTPPIPDEAYIFQSLDEGVQNYDPFIFYGISRVEGEAIDSANSELWSVEITVIKTDSDSKIVTRQLLRYGRALKEIFQENYYKINSVRQKLRVSSLEPISFSSQNSSNRFKAIGVEIEFSTF